MLISLPAFHSGMLARFTTSFPPPAFSPASLDRRVGWRGGPQGDQPPYVGKWHACFKEVPGKLQVEGHSSGATS